MRRFIMQMKPQRLEHVIAMVALFRPGPMDFIPTYIKRMHGEEEVAYRHPALKPIFEETYGIAVYQEQLMRAAVELAGYTNAESDDLRKAIAKKIKARLMKHREKFVSGAAAKGMAKDTAGKIFSEWEEFARYGFNKAHAADYGVIAVQTAYLKTHYPVEYMTAVLTAERHDTSRVSLYTADARRMGIDVRPPDVNYSDLHFAIEDDAEGKSAIRFGLGAVKNVGEGPVAAILHARADGHSFADLNEFCTRVDLRKVGKRALESLIKVGALDRFGPRHHLLAAMDQLLSISSSTHKAAEVGQISMFEMMGSAAAAKVELPTDAPEIRPRELRSWEKELVGVYVSDHPLMDHIEQIQDVITAYSKDLNETNHNDVVTLAGTVEAIRPHITKKGKSMAFVTLEDLQGNIDLLVFPRTWAEVRDWLAEEQIVAVTGRVDASNPEVKILVNTISRELKLSRPAPVVASSDSVMTARSAPAPAPPGPPQPVIETSAEPSPDDIWDVFAPDDWVDGDGGVEAPPSNASPPKELPATTGGDEAPAAGVTPSSAANGAAHELINGKARGDGYAGGPPLLDGETAQALKREGPPVRVTITLRPGNGLLDRYQLRVKWAWRIFTSFPGNDQFAMIVYEDDGRRFELDFPNITTSYCDDLLDQLSNIITVPNDIDVQPLLL